MKEYPSIPAARGTQFFEFDALVFDKLDGQNFRAEWSRKGGWYKFGSRTQLVDETHPDFGPAIAHFRESLDEALTAIAREHRLVRMGVFCEWVGERSFCGMHEDNDPLRLVVIEATRDKKGWVGPQEFRKMFEDRVPTPRYLGRERWSRGYVQRVREGEIECTHEGVIGKKLEGPRLIMSKAKTQAWLDAVWARYDPEVAAKLVNS